MANSAQARKRARQTEKRRIQKAAQQSEMRTAMKKVLKAVATGNKPAAMAAFQAAIPQIDTMVTKGILHQNTAARYKHRLNNRVKALPDN